MMRIVAHIDMDAFFAACEERYNPQFRGFPVVVGADPKEGRGRGVVSTANYAARKYGIRSALPITRAWRLAEDARMRGEPATIFLSGNYALYNEVSERIMKTIREEARLPKLFERKFEQASVDEAYLQWEFKIQNVKVKSDPWSEVEKRARAIKAEILQKEGLTCSVGIGPNKLVAKIASDFQKPDGFTVVYPELVEGFLAPMSIRAIPGIGPKGEASLNRRGIRTIGDLQRLDRETLQGWMGKWGNDLCDKARGISDAEVSNEGKIKSIGEEETFEQDTLQAAFILDRARLLADYVFERLGAAGFRSFRTVVVKVRFADFETRTSSHTLSAPRTTAVILNGEMLRLLLPFLDQRENPKRKKIRLIGVRVEKLG